MEFKPDANGFSVSMTENLVETVMMSWVLRLSAEPCQCCNWSPQCCGSWSPQYYGSEVLSQHNNGMFGVQMLTKQQLTDRWGIK